jgi:5-methylcytosine-specific restriction protein A
MKQNEAERLAGNLISKFGLPIKAIVKPGADAQLIILEPEGVHPNEGFKVQVNIGWRSLFIELSFGKFAADLVHQMGECSIEKKQLFVNISQEIINEKGVITFRINDTSFSPVNFNNWPSEWKTFSFSLRRSPLEINTEDHALTERLSNLWIERFFGCAIALSPLEEALLTEEEITGLPEGAVTRIPVNRYERSRYNRSLCINFHGIDCKACGMNFVNIYGVLGNGFIHVHHIVPVSKLGANYIINPIKDLVPVCANCHAMLHKTDPPMTVDELKQLIKAK